MQEERLEAYLKDSPAHLSEAKEKGVNIVGYFPGSFVPEELIRAAGAVPLCLVDGGGSYLLLRGDRASLGRVAADKPADVPIFSDVAERHASIARVEEDYFLFSDKDVEVAGRKTQHQLLRDGDRIVLGRKAKFTFRLPSRKSPTAVLDLSDTTKMPGDVRRVILFHQHATMGAAPNARISLRRPRSRA